MLVEIPGVVEHAQNIPEGSLGRAAFGVALLSSWHERQYSRLFRS
jgi:urease accessory protein UreF